MKKTNILKIFMTLVLAFVISGAFAQGYPTTIETDYEQATENTYQTENLGLTLYVAPDTAYNPTYDGTNPGVIDPLSVWQWVTSDVSFAQGVTDGNIEKAWANENYVVIPAANLPAAGGDTTYWVAERYSTGCADATGQSQTISVIAAPDGTMVGANTGGWTQINAGTEYYTCDPATVNVDDLTITFTEAVTGYEGFAYDVTVTAIRYDADGNPVDDLGNVIIDPDNATDVTATYGVETVADITAITTADFEASPVTVGVPAAMTYLQVSGANVKTKYVFTLSGVASRISTTSHYRQDGNLGSNTYYTPTVAQTVTYWLYLPPVTGPIYHIPNDFY